MPQQRLYFLPLPQGHRWFRPTYGSGRRNGAGPGSPAVIGASSRLASSQYSWATMAESRASEDAASTESKPSIAAFTRSADSAPISSTAASILIESIRANPSTRSHPTSRSRGSRLVDRRPGLLDQLERVAELGRVVVEHRQHLAEPSLRQHLPVPRRVPLSRSGRSRPHARTSPSSSASSRGASALSRSS